MHARVRVRQRLGKYRIEQRLGEGSYAVVYRATDTIEGIPVALKVPHPDFIGPAQIDDFRREVRIVAGLDHPNILPIKNADVIDEVFVVAYPLGEGTLADRLRRRYRIDVALDWAGQVLEGTAYAHHRGIIHCDIKPENVIMFPGHRVRLSDFGIAKFAQGRGTLTASGTGTIGFLAPEQAFGRPSYRSDVFSLGLLLYRMFSGELPDWPFDWPPEGYDRLRRSVSPGMVDLLRRAIALDDRKRYADAEQMLRAFRRLRPAAVRQRTRRGRAGKQRHATARSWRDARLEEFRRRHGKALDIAAECSRCGGPVSEAMRNCPWCGAEQRRYKGPTRFPGRCKRCGRGVKRDWPFCAWCYGGKIQEPSAREYSDVRYTGRCSNPACDRKELMPFMRYCPWCRSKVTRRWIFEGSTPCPGCRSGVVRDFWKHCPWCSRRLTK